MRIGEVRAEVGEPVTGTDMVVDDVEQYREPASVARVDDAFEPVGAAQSPTPS
ncbi:MAG TPA: hypothetical protein VLM11_09570 [Streptosporangiaceae bacterium]|nr:hypothetical protein [Streptosporangiaceae bacterium]